MQASLVGYVPLNRSDIMIAYGAVEIGGKKYICPIRSVSISRARSVANLRAWNDDFKTWGPYTTMLNDFVFEDYHMFRAQSRMLSYSTPNAVPISSSPFPQIPAKSLSRGLTPRLPTVWLPPYSSSAEPSRSVLYRHVAKP
jgi:hypothetical protein